MFIKHLENGWPSWVRPSLHSAIATEIKTCQCQLASDLLLTLGLTMLRPIPGVAIGQSEEWQETYLLSVLQKIHKSSRRASNLGGRTLLCFCLLSRQVSGKLLRLLKKEIKFLALCVQAWEWQNNVCYAGSQQEEEVLYRIQSTLIALPFHVSASWYQNPVCNLTSGSPSGRKFSPTDTAQLWKSELHVCYFGE